MTKRIPVIHVDTDIPIPQPLAAYPIRIMNVGDSMLIPGPFRSRVASNASHLKKRKGFEYTIRKAEAGNFRIWRIK